MTTCVIEREDGRYVYGPDHRETFGAFVYTNEIDQAKVFESPDDALVFVHKHAPVRPDLRATELKLKSVSVLRTVHLN